MQLKYQAVYDYINELINNQEPNTMIPSERVLSETLDISRMTVRKAIDIMVQEGKLYRKNNIGTFVSDNRLYKIYNTLTSFSDEVKSSGDIPGNIVLKFAKIPAPEKIAAKLNIPKGELIYEVIRVRLKNDVPLQVDFSYIPADIIYLDETIVQGSIYEYIRNELKLEIYTSIRRIVAVGMPENYAHHIHLKPNDPTIMDENVAYLKNGRIFELCISYRNQHKYELIIQSWK